MLNTVKVSAHLIILHTCLTRVQKFPEQCTFSACMLCTDHHFWSEYFTPSRLTNNWIFILLQWSHPSTQAPRYTVCDISDTIEEPKNWLITKFINIKNATRLDIEVTYNLLNCPLANVGPFCRTNLLLVFLSYWLQVLSRPNTTKFPQRNFYNSQNSTCTWEAHQRNILWVNIDKSKGNLFSITRPRSLLDNKKVCCEISFLLWNGRFQNG